MKLASRWICGTVLGFIMCLSSAKASDLEFDVTSTGVISLSDASTCTDLARGGATKSAKGPSVSFDALRIQWAPKNRDLFVQNISINLKNSNLAGGEQTFALSSGEIAALLGSSSGIIGADETNGNKVVISNRAENRVGFPLCAMNIGPLQFTSANPANFSAKVTIELSGISVNSADGSGPKAISKSFKTTALYY